MWHILHCGTFLRGISWKLVSTLLLVSMLLVPVLPAQATPPNPRLLKDIYPGAEGSQINDGSIIINDILYFVADDGTHGWELWRSDGTKKGTFLVKDGNPGPVGSWPWTFSFANVNGTLFFTADDGSHGDELWKSDGTAAGTMMVKDINLGTGESWPWFLTNFNGTLFFAADNGTHGRELWKSDGTAAGTMMVKDINLGTGTSSPWCFSDVNGMLFFVADDGLHGPELWKTDGTAVGTMMIKDINFGLEGSDAHGFGGSAEDQHFIEVNGKFFLLADDGSHGSELWKTDGTAAGTMMVKDINPGTGSTSVGDFTIFNGMLFLSADDGSHGRELWKSDGTAARTMMVKDIYPGFTDARPEAFTTVNGTLFFRADYTLWKSDGTLGGTKLIKDINSRPVTLPEYLTNVNGTLFFTACNSKYGCELWKSDGTKAGTKLVKDIYAGPDSAETDFTFNANGTLFFNAMNRLWKSDGTKAGTVTVGNIAPVFAGMRMLLKNSFLVVAEDGTHGAEWWVVDLTKPTTQDTLIDAATDEEVPEENISDAEADAIYQAELADQEAELADTDENTIPEKVFLPLITLMNSIKPMPEENLLDAAIEEEISEKSISDTEAEAVYQAELAAQEAELAQTDEGVAGEEMLSQKIFLPLIAR